MNLRTALPTLYTDNDAASKLTKSNHYHRRTRHIDHKWHYIRQETNRGNLIVLGVNTEHQLADVLTKLNPMSTITKWKKAIGVMA